MSETEGTTPQEVPPVEEESIEEEEDEEEEEEQPRLKSMVERLLKQAKRNKAFKEGKLAGKTLEQQYDLLEFYIDNQPKMKSKNKKIVRDPTHTASRVVDGILIMDNPDTGKKSYVIDPKTLFKTKS